MADLGELFVLRKLVAKRKLDAVVIFGHDGGLPVRPGTTQTTRRCEVISTFNPQLGITLITENLRGKSFPKTNKHIIHLFLLIARHRRAPSLVSLHRCSSSVAQKNPGNVTASFFSVFFYMELRYFSFAPPTGQIAKLPKSTC